MKRRTACRLLGAGGTTSVTGCLDLSIGQSRSAPTVEEGLQRRVSISDRDSVPDESRIGIDVELLEPTITGSHTARIRITTTNDGDRRNLSISTGGCALFNRRSQGSVPEGTWLRLVEEMTETQDADSRWSAGNLPELPEGFGGYGCTPRTYETGESVRTDYAVFHDGRVNGYLNPGTYRFEEEVHLWENPSADADSSPTTTFTWGFSIALDDPD